MTASPPASASRAWRPRANPWLIAVTVTLAAFMEVLDTTIVNVALPHIAGTVSSSYDEATWILTSYLVANGIVLPISAFLARRFGRKRYFTLCIVAFTICSLLCGLATSLWQLILFRVLQGFFGGGLQPSQQAIILDTFEPSQRGRAFSVTAVATVVAPILGPTLGGWITDNFSWRWVFLINVPVGVFTVLCVLQWVEDPPWEKAIPKLSTDYIGIGLIAVGLGFLQVMLDRGEDDDWFSSPFIIGCAAISAAGIAGTVLWLLYAKKPVLDLRCLKDRNFTLGCATIASFAMILYGSAVLIPQLAQQHLGYTATLSGLVLTPGAFCIVLLIPLISRVMPYVQTRYILAVGFFLLGCALLYSHELVPGIDYRTLVLMRSAQSIAIGFLFVPASTLTYLTLPRYLNGDGAALFTMFRNVAGSIGISLSTALITTRTQVHMAYLSEHLTALSQPYTDALARIAHVLKDSGQNVFDPDQGALGQIYLSLMNQASILAYLDVFAVCALFAWACVPFTFLFSPAKSAGGAGAA